MENGERTDIRFLSWTHTRRLLGLGTKGKRVRAMFFFSFFSFSYLLSHTSFCLPTFTHSPIPLSAPPSLITMTANLHFLTPEQKQKVIQQRQHCLSIVYSFTFARLQIDSQY